MAPVRWNPWATMPTVQDRINRVFDDIFPAQWQREDAGLMEWRPVVDTYEKDDAIVIKAELPGVKKDDISIDVRQNVLTLSGERTHDQESMRKSTIAGSAITANSSGRLRCPTMWTRKRSTPISRTGCLS